MGDLCENPNSHRQSLLQQRPVNPTAMASNSQNPDSAAPLFFSSAVCFLTSGIFGLMGYYQRQQLQALRNATIIRVRGHILSFICCISIYLSYLPFAVN